MQQSSHSYNKVEQSWVYKPQTPSDNCCLCSKCKVVNCLQCNAQVIILHETCTILFNKLLFISISISTLLPRATGCLFGWASKQIMAVNHPLFLRQATAPKCCLAGIKKHGKFLQCGVSLSFILVACNTTRRLLLHIIGNLRETVEDCFCGHPFIFITSFSSLCHSYLLVEKHQKKCILNVIAVVEFFCASRAWRLSLLAPFSVPSAVHVLIVHTSRL